MKNFNLIFLSGIFLMASACGPTQVVQTESYDPAPPPVQEVTVSYQSFYDDLSPYGNWVNYPGYGYVWMPNTGPDFIPYNTNRNWIYTEAGWTWASNYSWGWAPFHYGRWFYENGYGWMWIPGNEWAPAWVSWRGGNDYYGWAPLGPDVSVSVALGSYNPPVNYWNFVPRQYMGSPQWHNYYVNQSRNVTIINNTTIINNYSGTNRARYSYAPGPDPNEVRRVSGVNVRPVPIRDAARPGSRVSGNQFEIYRPRVNAASSNRADASVRPAPARVQPLREVRPQPQNPDNAGRPAAQPQTLPNNNSRPVTRPEIQNPGNNNSRPVTEQPRVNPAAAPTGHPVDSRPNPASGNARPLPQQQRAASRPASPNRVQTRVKPAAGNQNSHPQQAPPKTTRPVRQAPQPTNRPVRQAPKPVQQAPRVQPNSHPAPGQEEKKTERPVTRPVR